MIMTALVKIDHSHVSFVPKLYNFMMFQIILIYVEAKQKNVRHVVTM
jgi:hypothetical protein